MGLPGSLCVHLALGWAKVTQAGTGAEVGVDAEIGVVVEVGVVVGVDVEVDVGVEVGVVVGVEVDAGVVAGVGVDAEVLFFLVMGVFLGGGTGVVLGGALELLMAEGFLLV